MTMEVHKDNNDHKYMEWKQADIPGGWKRVWIQHREVTDSKKNWANTPDGRYLNVVRVSQSGSGPAGNATDFPIFSDRSDEEILQDFIQSVSGLTGCPIHK